MTIGEYQLGPIVGRPVLLMAKAAADHVLVAALELSWLDQLARQSGLPDHSTLVITDRSGRVLAGAQGPITGFRQLVASPGKMREVIIDGAERLAVAVALWLAGNFAFVREVVELPEHEADKEEL